MGHLKVVKKVGAYNESGECIIPLRYDEIKKLKTGVYVAKSLCRSENPPFKDNYHLYTEKCRLEYQYEGRITEVLYDQNQEIIALEINDGINCEWHLVEVDYENNVINKLYKNSISVVKLLSNNCIELLTFGGTTEIFSRKVKKIILSLATEVKIDFVSQKGFILTFRGKTAFVNLEGEYILDFDWDDIRLLEEFISVIKGLGNNEYNHGLYTYEGKEVFPCTYWGMEFFSGITPERCCIDGATVWLFNTHRKENGIYYDELIKADGEVILSISGDDVFMSDVSISVYERDNVIVKQKNKATLYKLEMNNLREIPALVLCEADKIEKLPKYGQYSVYKGRKKGKCNKNGTMIEPLRFMVRKE